VAKFGYGHGTRAVSSSWHGEGGDDRPKEERSSEDGGDSELVPPSMAGVVRRSWSEAREGAREGRGKWESQRRMRSSLCSTSM
jgi:hypothetical protein